jgi:hypothetical protein
MSPPAAGGRDVVEKPVTGALVVNPAEKCPTFASARNVAAVTHDN